MSDFVVTDSPPKLHGGGMEEVLFFMQAFLNTNLSSKSSVS